ncbi:MAG: TonB-dependent receptor [Bacteroidetes bacterium]|nr:TonB-dependent receptor [Bacteroidota bacterium]
MKKLILVFLFLGGLLPAALAQQQVTGKVTDALTAEALPGAAIVIKGTSTGTVTDVDGNFKLEVPGPDALLVVSYIGYLQEEVRAGSGTMLNITLSPDLEQLDEVVVVGYGSQKKSDITGSVAIVDSKEMQKYATSDVSQLLQGRASGVQVTADGQPGANPNIRIRGVGTFGDSQPLYVVDGVPVGTSIRDFNPNDIESVQVLKDASAGAIYGSRAANGVVIITTKQGKKGTPLTVEYSGYYGIDEVWQRMPVLGRQNYQVMANEVRMNGGRPLIPGNDPGSEFFISDVDTDWQDESLKNGSRQNHSLNFSGGGEYTTYNLSLDYFNNEGILKGNGPDYRRYSARLNSTAEKGIFKVGTSLYYTNSHENSLTFRGDVLTGGRPPLINDITMGIPTLPVYDENNEGGYAGTSSTIHQVIILNVPGINHLFENWVDVDRIFTNVYGEMKLLDTDGHSLKFKTNLGWDKTMTRDFSFVPEFEMGYFFGSGISRLDDNSRQFTVGLIENTLNYNKAFGKHTLDLLVGQTFQKNDFVERTGHSEALPKPYYKVLANGSNQTASGIEINSALSSYLGRINYDFNSRYLLTATVRRDGSSRFAPANRYGTFPSLALGWRISEEEFFPQTNAITELKLRGSYGQLGNQNIGDYLYQARINRNMPYHFGGTDGGYNVVTGGLQTSLVSQDIKWETSTMSNFGFDARLFDGRFDFTAEYYIKETTDILVGVPIPASTGSINQAPVVNAGSLRNKGIDLELVYHKLMGDFTFDVAANMSTVKNEVLALGGNNEPIYGVGTKTEVGGEIGRHFGYEYVGLFQNQEQISGHAQQDGAAPGDMMFKDQITVDTDGDGIPDAADGVINADDRVYLGSGIPSVNYGLNFSARYKNFDFTMFASGAAGYQINSRLYRTLMHTTDYINWHEDILDRWTPGNTDTDVPRVVIDDPNGNGRDSNRPGWLQDGKHLRINTISLGYNLPGGIIKALQTARIYATCQNLYTFQAYKGYNPYFTSGVFNPGFDNGSYPRPRTYMLGVQVSF